MCENTNNTIKLKRAKKSQLIQFFLITILQTFIIFVAAGQVNIPRVWLFAGVITGFYGLSILILFTFFPHITELMNRRGEIKETTKWWDKLFLKCAAPTIFVIIPVVIGLDIGRFGWSHTSIQISIIAVVIYMFAGTMALWALIENTYFETTVRIQTDRGHKVITTGPYRFIRHPGYFAIILLTISGVLIPGSLYALIPAGVIVILLIIRTAQEDRMLYNELEGYVEYTKKVKYRLCPWIW